MPYRLNASSARNTLNMASEMEVEEEEEGIDSDSRSNKMHKTGHGPEEASRTKSTRVHADLRRSSVETAVRENIAQKTTKASTHVVVSSLDLHKATDTSNSGEDRVHNHAIGASERLEPSKTKKTLRFAQEVKVSNGSPRRVKRRGDNVLGDEESRKAAIMKPGRVKERTVGYWTATVTPTPSRAESLDEEEVDELDSSPIKPTDEDDDDNGAGSLFTPPRKKRRVISLADSATSGDEDVKAVADCPHLRKVTRSPSSKIAFGRDTHILSPRKRNDAPSPIKVTKTSETVSTHIQPKSEPDTPKAAKRKRPDPSPYGKKPKVEYPTSKKEVLESRSMPQETKANQLGRKAEEKTPHQRKDEEEGDTWEQRRIYEQRRRWEKAPREERDEQEKRDQVQALRERREEYKKKWRAKPVRRVKKEDEIRLKEKSRVGEMLRNEKKMESSRLRRAKQKKAHKSRRNAV
ncbi:hypothetical protein BDZ89DRAFT_530535 [Hymenopellis radicata]|nr:hypothetical protein BDZ89DRAFT_530535 [Hymenopellis radicata]